MESFTIDNEIWVLTQPSTIMTTENAVLQMDEGALWASVRKGNAVAGVAILGSGRFALDAIVETDMGAVGKSIETAIAGMQIVLGIPSVEEQSRAATEDDLARAGIHGTSEFLDLALQLLDDESLQRVKSRGDRHTRLIVGSGDQGRWLVLAHDIYGTVFVRDDETIAIARGAFVHVRGNEVQVTLRNGHRLRLHTKHRCCGHHHEVSTTHGPLTDFTPSVWGRLMPWRLPWHDPLWDLE